MTHTQDTFDLEDLPVICRALPGTTEDVKWGADLCFCVAGKMYAVTGLESGGVSLKTTPETFAELVQRPGIEPAAYVARYHWVSLAEDPLPLPTEQIAELVRESYALVRAKLPKRVRDALG